MLYFSYPATVEEYEPGDFVIRFADVPEAMTFGRTPQEALANAPDALATAIDHYIDREPAVPLPRAAKAGEFSVTLDPDIAARVILKHAMTEQGLSNVALARRMHRDEKAVRRILSGRRASFALTLAALKAVGLRPALAV